MPMVLSTSIADAECSVLLTFLYFYVWSYVGDKIDFTCWHGGSKCCGVAIWLRVVYFLPESLLCQVVF